MNIEMANALKEANEKFGAAKLSWLSVSPRIPEKQRDPEVLAENEFRRMLCCERKRAERSSRGFLLMLVSTGDGLRESQRGKALRGVVSAVANSTRETDIAGWYVEDAVVGVIFVEFGNASGETLARLMRARLTGTLSASLPPEEFSQVHISFHFFPDARGKSSSEHWFNEKLYPDVFEGRKDGQLFCFLKRVMDIAGSVAALVLFSPLLITISIAIKLTSRGPVLFRQERVGRCGTKFVFLKFRSMKCGNNPGIHREYVARFITGRAEPGRGGNGNAVFKIQDDPRVTRVGKLLRRTSLDELPQFLNVLRGDMSLVGPRPPLPYEWEIYQTWHRRRVLEVKPGITGLWQVSGRSRTTFDEMVRLDLRYARTWSPWLDVKILMQTPRAVLSGEGAY